MNIDIDTDVDIDIDRQIGILHVEYVEQRTKFGIRFIFSPFCEYIYFEYVRIYVIYRVNQAEYGIHVLLVAPQEYVNIYSTCRIRIHRYIDTQTDG